MNVLNLRFPKNCKSNLFKGKQASYTFLFRGFKDKNTLCWCIKEPKTRNKLKGRYLELKKQEANYESQITGLKCNKECTRHVFRDGNKSSKVRLIYLKISKHGERHGWCFCKQTVCDVKSQQNKIVLCIYRFNGFADTFRS